MARQPKRKKISDEDVVKNLSKEIDELVFSEKIFSTSNIESIKDDIWEKEYVLSFEDFCKSPEHMNFPKLSERQRMVVDYLLGDDYKKVFENNRNIAVLVWGKGCFIGTEEILTYDGKRITFEEAYKQNIPLMVYSLKEANKEIVYTYSTPAIKKKKKEKCYLIVTKFGFKYLVSEDHQFYTDKGWKKVSEIIPQENSLYAPCNYPIYNIYTDITEDEAYLCGLIFKNRGLYIKNTEI